jgi:glycosyltransferase involved in cell wall biosynthesis
VNPTMERATPVSVVTPCFNGERTVTRCVESLLVQGYPNLEWVFVDDGSTDGSRQALDACRGRIADAGIRLKYCRQENRGLAGAVWTGLQNATGNYLCLLDIDDQYLERSIARRAAYLDEHPEAAIVFGNGYSVYEDGRSVPFADSPRTMDHLFDKLVDGTQYNWAGSYMLRADPLRSFYAHRPFFMSRHGQNLQILMPVAYRAGAGYIHEPLMRYHRSTRTLSRVRGDYEQRLAAINGYEEIRLNLVGLVVEPTELRRYEEVVRTVYVRQRMHLAHEYGKRAEVEKEFAALSARGAVRRDDRMLLACSRHRWVEPLYRAARALRHRVRLGSWGP